MFPPSRSRVVILCLALSLCATSAAGQVNTPKKTPPVILTIDGEVPQPRQLTASDLAKLPRSAVQVKESDGSTTTFEGVNFADALGLAGLTLGEDLGGPRLETYLLVQGADGFKAVFALPEISTSFTDRLVILADLRNGSPLPATEGPLRSVVQGEKRKARSIKQVIRFTVLRAVSKDISPPRARRKRP